MSRECKTESKGISTIKILIYSLLVVVLVFYLIAWPSYLSMRRHAWAFQYWPKEFYRQSEELMPNKQGIALTEHYGQRLSREFWKLNDVLGFDEAKKKFRSIIVGVLEVEVPKFETMIDTMKLFERIRKAVKDTVESRFDVGEAKMILSEQVTELRKLHYSELLKYKGLDGKEEIEVVGTSGTTYKLEVISFYDKPEANLRVQVSLRYDNLPAAIYPMEDEFVISPDGSFVGE